MYFFYFWCLLLIDFWYCFLLQLYLGIPILLFFIYTLLCALFPYVANAPDHLMNRHTCLFVVFPRTCLLWSYTNVVVLFFLVFVFLFLLLLFLCSWYDRGRGPWVTAWDLDLSQYIIYKQIILWYHLFVM